MKEGTRTAGSSHGRTLSWFPMLVGPENAKYIGSPICARWPTLALSHDRQTRYSRSLEACLRVARLCVYVCWHHSGLLFVRAPKVCKTHLVASLCFLELFLSALDVEYSSK